MTVKRNEGGGEARVVRPNLEVGEVNTGEMFGSKTKETAAAVALANKIEVPSSIADLAAQTPVEAARGVEKSKGDFSANTIEIIRKDLGSNAVMNYSKINFAEILMSTGFDLKFAVTHWRVAKIIDGIIMCFKEYDICAGVMHPDLPGMIYKQLEKPNGVHEDYWAVKLPIPGSNPPDKKELKVPLAKFADFVSLVEANRALGSARVSREALLYKHFTGQDVNVSYQEKNVNLSDVSGRDTYEDLDFKKDYLQKIDKYQGPLQLLSEWRYERDGHRENAAHAMQVQTKVTPLRAEYGYLPTSGRLSSAITLGDLFKQVNKGLNGHPHEIGELCEDTGVLTRINATDLSQRNAASMPNKHDGSQRLANMALGMDADGNGEVVVDTTTKKKIYLNCVPAGGVNKTSITIKGMRARYDKMRENMGLKVLTDEEAADLYVTDVLAPYFLKNSRDWLMFLAQVHKVRGDGIAPANISDKQAISKTASMNSGSWDDFELNIFCRQPDGKYMTRTFDKYKDLWDYLHDRYMSGSVDQAIHIPDTVAEKEKNTVLDDKAAPVVKKVLELALTQVYEEIDDVLKQYVNGESDTDLTYFETIKQGIDQLYYIGDVGLQQAAKVLLGVEYDAVSKDYSGAKSLATLFVDYISSVSVKERKKILAKKKSK